MSTRPARILLCSLLGGLVLSATGARAEHALVGVASNFAPVAAELAAAFEAESGHRLRIANASTGKLFAQIVNGAPYDVYLAADQARPIRLVEEGRAIAGTRRTYALGRLALWSLDPSRPLGDLRQVLRVGAFRHLAIAHPDLAPYGAAAKEALERLGLYSDVEARLVLGENIGQTYALVATANAELGFVAASQLAGEGRSSKRNTLMVPADLHAPIRQDAVLLSRAEGNAAARGFLDYLATPSAVASIRAAGYEVER